MEKLLKNKIQIQRKGYDKRHPTTKQEINIQVIIEAPPMANAT
ncbi:hypothetical protein COLO4_20034 [Corchorus olitorius]|uniref:Uncharacterized protein n=1 Tax=Corchorus olitorius TaxID=93759 RepID=A0A1R3J238_9ROSI|nr:hypothetical protein COLO4_20034 [Corchorus olitorius]